MERKSELLKKKIQSWESNVPRQIREDVIWKVQVYRIALYLSDLNWDDCNAIEKRKRFSLCDQLNRSVGSISANIIEGYSRRSPKEKCRFYEYALGSARESKDWYYKCRHILSDETALDRIDLLTSIIKLLQTMITDYRRKSK